MQRYSEFRPTAFDPCGLGLEDQQDWWVAPVGRTRDSGPLEESNFETVLADIGGEGDDVEVHRFGHWGPGWFEVILVRPGTPAADACEEWERRLEEYPVADEEDFSQREFEIACDAWEGMSMWDRIEVCAECGVSIFAARRDEYPEGIDYEVHGDGSVYWRAH